MIKRNSIIIITVIFVIFAVLGFLYLSEENAPPSEDWTITFGKKDIDETFYSVQQTQDGGFVLAGYIYFNNWTSTDDILLVKTDARGSEQWSRIFARNISDRAYSVQQTADGGFILADWSGWAIKTDERGYEQWNRTYKNAGVKSIQQIYDDGYIFAGFAGSRAESALLIKANAIGNELWNKTFREEKDSSSTFLSVKQTSDGGYIAAGATDTESWAKSGAAIIVKTDTDGNIKWSKRFKGFERSKPKFESYGYGARSVQQTPDGGYIIAGNKKHVYVDSWADYSFDTEIWLIKLDAEGDEQWNRTFGKYNSWANSMEQTSDGGYVLVGSTNEVGWFSSNAYGWIIKTDKEGTIQWSKRFDSKAQPYYVQQTSDGGYVVTGYVYENDNQGKLNIRRPVDGWVIKLRGEGAK